LYPFHQHQLNVNPSALHFNPLIIQFNELSSHFCCCQQKGKKKLYSAEIKFKFHRDDDDFMSVFPELVCDENINQFINKLFHSLPAHMAIST